MKTKTAPGPCAAVMLGLIALTPDLWGGEIPEISKPVGKGSADYPETIGGAPISGGFSEGNPRVSSQTHGWKLPIPGPHRLIRVTEILRAPGPSTWRAWDTQVTLNVSPERDSCMTNWSEYPEDGWIENSWEIEPSDPRGWYSFEVYFDGRLAATIPFEVK